jgi:acyl-CoA reductase-like NAD-dependent aldehyde dehydrogenase
MENEPRAWQNFSPGDLAFAFPEVAVGDVSRSVARSVEAFPSWAARSLDERRDILSSSRERLLLGSESLAALISQETGKPLREARLEMAAVVAKFDLTFADGEKHLRDVPVHDGPNPGLIRQHPRGPAAVIAPFNFPVHLGHGAAVAYLLAGNTVLFKPSPQAANVGLAYGRIMQEALPPGVFQVVPGWGATGRALRLDKAVRSVCFTGSVPVGRELACSLAADTSKSLALELGGKKFRHRVGGYRSRRGRSRGGGWSVPYRRAALQCHLARFGAAADCGTLFWNGSYLLSPAISPETRWMRIRFLGCGRLSRAHERY